MNNSGTLRPDLTMIGDVAEPPFIRLPDPESLFTNRAERCRTVAESHQLGAYLCFFAAIGCQHRNLSGLPASEMCGSTNGITYQGLDGCAGAVMAETCETCRSHAKIFRQHKKAAPDKKGYPRGAVNAFLLGY